MPSAFISYSWDNESHKNWVRDLASRLRSEGVDVTLDQWHLALGDQLPEFMERSIRDNDFVLIICTPHYKEKSEGRIGGVGYEGDIITAEVFAKRNHKKFIPILRNDDKMLSLPSWLSGKCFVNLNGNPYSEDEYNDLLATLHNVRQPAPPVGSAPISRLKTYKEDTQKSYKLSEIKILGIITDEISIPKNDGTHGSALYSIPFKLSSVPSSAWNEAFIAAWKSPERYTLMHRPDIARIQGDKVILDGTTIEEVKRYHRDTLISAAQKANRIVKESVIAYDLRIAEEKQRIEKHKQHVETEAESILFD